MTMLGNKNNKKKTAIGGIGIAVLLCALMAFMPMTSLVDNTTTDTVSVAEISNDIDDFFKLPAAIEQTTYEYDATQELLGMRQANTKAFLTEDGKIAQLTSDEPVHYLADSGAFEDINLNIMATPNGWEVKENTFTTTFGAELSEGVSVQPNQFVDPIITGLNPILMTIDITGTAPMPYQAAPAMGDVEVGGNVIRYPLAEGFAIDYSVETNQVKQNLIIEERPVLDEVAAYFGMTETIRLPMGYALYLDGAPLGEEITTTQGELEIRSTDTGELLATIPEPVVMEESSNEPYIGTYFVQVYGPMVLLTTAVDTDWLMSEDRVFPLALDPTIKVTSGNRGYCYVYYGYCYNNTYSYLYRYYSSYYYVPWHKYTFTSSSALPSGATVEEVNWKQYVSYAYGSSSSTSITSRVLESCGTDVRYNYGITSATCSGGISANLLSGTNSNTNERKLISSIGNSAAVGTYAQGTGWKTSELCDNSNSAGTACSSSTGSHNYIINAQSNSGTVGMGADMTSSIYVYTYAYNSGGSNSYLEVIYSGGSDSDAPTSSHVPYSGLTSYVEGERTFFTTLTDLSGVDTTSTNGVTMSYSVNNGSWTSVSATTIQTCTSTASECRFKATTSDISAGDYVEYYWKFQDLNTAGGANVGYDPAPPASNSAPGTWVESNAHYFFVDDITNAGNAKKFTVLTTDVHSGSYYSPQGYHDRQMTYYDHSDEYLYEWDVSNCGTGSYSCFYSSSYYFYSQWKIQWTTTPSGGYNGYGGTQSGLDELHQGDGGYLAISAKNGPQMNLIFHYDSGDNAWGMVGIGDSTPEIETGALAGGSQASSVSTYGYTAAYNVPIPGDITGTFGKITWNGTGYSTSKANWLCVGTNGFYYFYRSSSSNARCNTGYYYAYQTSSYKWSGVALSAGYYGRMATSGSITYKVGKVAPTPDTSSPDMEHSVLRDSHSKSRTFTYTIADAGDPPSGLNVNQTLNEGPTLHYSVNNGSTTSILLSPVGKTRSECAAGTCDWAATVNTFERGDYVEYYATSVDESTVSAGVNTETTTSNTFEVGDPNMMLIVEWRDMGYNTQYLCDYQVIFYDVTNEIEFKYDSGCAAYYDYATVGYMDHTRTKGDSMRNPGAGYMAGNNPHSSNYRISTDGNDHGYEAFSTGIKPVSNAAQVISGSSGGTPTGYYCSYSYYWNQYKTGCNANIDLPSGFTFDYFQKSFDGDDSNDRLRIGRNGYLYMIDNGATSLERGITTWGTSMPDLPYSSNSAARPGTIAPWWGYYSSYYCYDNTAYDCGVYVRTMPFEGKGTDVDNDLDCSGNNVECIWDNEGSPYRISPSSDYLSVSGGDLTIQPGTVIQVEQGKGISIDGACDSVKAIGNSTDHILFEGAAGAEWKGLSFTDDCTTTAGTDDRHVFSYVDFNNTSTAAITAGSRHQDYNAYCADSNGGTRPCYSNANVGNFTLSQVTFTNVETAISHGSGQGTGITMMNFAISGADKACINLPSSANAMIMEGTMSNCNSDGESWGGAIVNYPGSTGGMLHVENVTIENAYKNLIDTDLQHVTISNVSASFTTSGAAQTGVALDSAFGTSSEVNIFNLDAPGYSSVSINALGSINMTDVDIGTATLSITPGGSSSTANGPSGDFAIFHNIDSGDISMTRIQPSIFNDVTAGHIDISGNAISTDVMSVSNLDSGRFGVAGCGWKIDVTTIDSDRVYSSCSSSAAPNNFVVDGGTLSHTSSTDHALYARNSKMTVGDVDITSSNAGSGVYLAYASSNAEVRLIDVSQNTDDCADSNGATSDCDVYTSSSALIYYGGTATLRAYRLEAVNSVIEEVNKSGHVVSASVVSGAGAELFEVGSHITDANGEASVWVITGDSAGNTYSDHNLRAFGPAGQNETLSSDTWYANDLTSGFTIGSSYALLLEPAPVDFNGTNMDCSWLAAWTDADTGAGLPTNGTTAAGGVIYEFDGTPMTLTEDLNLNGCVVKLMGAVLAVKSTATSTPVLTLSNGGKLLVGKSSVATGALKAVSSTYPLTIDIQDGTLEIDGGIVRDVAQDATTGSALYVGDGATLIMKNSGTVYGSSASSTEMATVKIDGGSADIASSSIINVANTGTALWVEQAGGSYTNLAVSNAAVGIQAYNGAPQIDGFTSTDNTVGVDVYGGMSLPTIYRSTSLSGQSTGWTTYAVDLSTFIGSSDYLQVGANSIYGGGNAHPTYNYASSKYYMITDRWNIEVTYDDGSGEVSENITTPDKMGYYPWGSSDPKSGNGAATYAGGEGGVASWHCNQYGYSYGPSATSNFDGYMYYLWRYWPQGPQTFPSYPGYYYYPDQFGFRWSEIDADTTPNSGYYPYHYWGYYYTSYHGGQGAYKPVEGYVGGSYNVCLDYAYSYYMNPGQGARMSFPVVDISDSSISKVTMYVDVLHNRADNYQDRLDLVARAGNDPSDLGDYLRDSGTASFKNGVITGADNGIEIGGNFAAGTFESIDITSPTDSGVEVTGAVSAAMDDIEVNGGDYGMLVSSSGSGSIDLTNMDFDAQNTAGIYYVKNFGGDLSGSITNSAGAAYKYGPLTSKNVVFDGITLAGNDVGLETAGSQEFTITDSAFASTTNDIVVTGSSKVDFIEGTVDTSKVSVTGTGDFERMRELEMTIEADGSGVQGTTVVLMNADKKITGTGTTDANGDAFGVQFRTVRVDSSGTTSDNLAGYQAATVAMIEYTSSKGDFRYAFEGLSLSDASGNTGTIDLTERIEARVCYTYSSSSYVMVAGCSGSRYLGTGSSRSLTDGDGGSYMEYGYYGATPEDMSGKTIMVDVPFMYFDNNEEHNWNNTKVLVTGSYTFSDTQRWYAQGGSDAPELYLHDSEVYGLAVNPTSGQQTGVEIGYVYQAMDISIKNSTLNPIASVTSGMAYASTWSSNDYVSEWLRIDNVSMTHYKGYTPLNNAISTTDICVNLYGSDNSYIIDSTLSDCGAGIFFQRSGYSYGHNANEFGADNTTIEGNTFLNGGEIADVWFYTNSYADDTVVKDNTFSSSTAKYGVRAYDQTTKRLTVTDNTFDGPETAVQLINTNGYLLDGNSITGVSDASKPGITINGGYGDVSNNTLLDADGGIRIDSAEAPPAPSTSLCTIAGNSYRTTSTCTFTIPSGATAYVDLETDSWGGEVGLEITKPDGTTDTWAYGTFSSNTAYARYTSYSVAGSYSLKVLDSWGDGGTNIAVYYGTSTGGYSGPVVENNTIGLSPGRVAPNAIGLDLVDCNSVTIQSQLNTINMGDNAVVTDGCDISDVDSNIVGTGISGSIGMSSLNSGDDITLSGTDISGYAYGVSIEDATLTLTGAASVAGSTAGVYAEDATVTAIDASVDGGATGTGLYMVDGDYSWIYPLDAAGDVGVYAENTEFRWDGGTSTATTALHAVESVGSVENLTWSASTTQINAGSNAYVTSIGNTLDSNAISIVASATIDEANLFSLDATHLQGTASAVGMSLLSTDGTRAAYVSPAFQPDIMAVDGDDSDWIGGTPLNPSDDAMPGMVSGDGTNDLLVTYSEGDALYIGMTGEDLATNDLLIYLDVVAGGSNTGYNLNAAHTLPVQADYLFWATSDTNMDLYSNGFLGWGASSMSTDAVDADLGTTTAGFFEIAIPFSRLGGTPDAVNIVAILQDGTANIQNVHPSQTVTTGAQTLTEYISIETTHEDLETGSISDEVLVYRTYKGSTTAGAAKDYDVMIKTQADCAYDWATVDAVSMATNQQLTVDIKRACPEIQAALADDAVDEDSGVYTMSLTNLADDVQDDEATLTWTATEGTTVAHSNVLVDWNKNGHTVSITPLDDQFGTIEFEFVVTDSHGLTDTKNMTLTVNNINDKPVICNTERIDCMPVFVDDGSYTNIVPEGFGSVSKFLGDISNASKSYVRDMDNEQDPTRQVYTWGASVPTDCIAFSVDVVANELTMTENTGNELGGTCPVTLTLSDDGAENTAADNVVVDFSVSPVNDAPVVLDWDVTTGAVVTSANGSTPVAPWSISLMEDDTSVQNLTYDLSAVKYDVDHNAADLAWTVEPTDQCTYQNYFTATIQDDNLVFELVPDATTNANAWEIDYLNDNGIHQIGPSGSDFCQIRLVLKDTATAPSYVPNYDPAVMSIASYTQGVATQEIGVRVENVRELVGDYYFDDAIGFDFLGINNVLSGTYVPVEVTIGAGGDVGPFTYDHMLAVTFHTDGGHGESENVKYYPVPAYGETMIIQEYVYIVNSSGQIYVEMDVLTCLDEECDLSKAPADRFQTDDPTSHRANSGGQQGDDWSKPGQYGSDATKTSERRPLLEDSDWCNNVMYSTETAPVCNHANQPASTFLAANNTGRIPSVVSLGSGLGSVPSFAPSLVVVALAGFFVTALAMSSRRDEEDVEEDTRIVDDEMAVSPVIATILMVAITVVLSGVIYVWASSLAETGKLGTPRVTFDKVNENLGAADGYWAISVDQTEAELSTQSVIVTVLYTDSTGTRTSYATSLANTSDVYGFSPANSDAFVTFFDKVEDEGTYKESTFGIGDQIMVRTHAPDGTAITDGTIRITYQPGPGEGSVIKTYSDLEYNKV